MTHPGDKVLTLQAFVVNASLRRLWAGFSPVWRESFPVTGAFDYDLVAGIGQPVQGVIAQDRIIKQPQLFFDCPVTDDCQAGLEVFGDEALTGALLDRLTHRCHILEMNGESYRFKESMRRKRENMN